MGAALTPVPFDIETTGLGSDDEVTVVGFELELGCRVFCQTGGQAITGEAIAERVTERCEPVENLVVSTHDDEAALLTAVKTFAVDRFSGDEQLLVAYNGETYRGGFDLPFLRTRLARCDAAWPFAELPYADLLPVIRDQFNTTVDGEAHNDLDSAYQALCDGTLHECDPFTESSEAVAAYAAGEIVPVVQHNVVDIRQTGALARLARRYCSKADISLKSLTPTAQAFRDERR